MIGLIEFNRRLNIKSYVKLFNGKAVRVKSHRRQAILRAHEALDELLTQGESKAKEYGFTMTKKGKLSQIHKGDFKSVDIKGGKNTAFYGHSHTLDRKYITNKAFPSPADLAITLDKDVQGAVINPTIFGPYKARFYLKNTTSNPLYRYQETYDKALLISLQLNPNIDPMELRASLSREVLRTQKGFIHYREYGEAAKVIREHDQAILDDTTKRYLRGQKLDKGTVIRVRQGWGDLYRRFAELRETIAYPKTAYPHIGFKDLMRSLSREISGLEKN